MLYYYNTHSPARSFIVVARCFRSFVRQTQFMKYNFEDKRSAERKIFNYFCPNKREFRTIFVNMTLHAVHTKKHPVCADHTILSFLSTRCSVKNSQYGDYISYNILYYPYWMLSEKQKIYPFMCFPI